MKNTLLITCLLIILLTAFENTSFAQKKTCTCKEVGGRTCTAEVTCTNGCSAICGKKDTCSVSCSLQVYPQNLNIDFVKQTTTEIATTLAKGTRLRLNFTPNPGTEKEVYDYQLKNSDVWRLLEFLDARGTLIVNGIDFDNLRDLKKQLRKGEKLASVTFNNIPVEEAVARLEIMTGEDLQIVSGDSTKRVTVSVTDVSLAEVLKAIRKKTRVHVAVCSSV